MNEAKRYAIIHKCWSKWYILIENLFNESSTMDSVSAAIAKLNCLKIDMLERRNHRHASTIFYVHMFIHITMKQRRCLKSTSNRQLIS